MEGLTLTVDDKLRIAQKIDELGVQYIEGGWPGLNPKDAEFFARAHNELRLKHAKLVTFSSTRRAGTTPGKDANLRITVGAKTPVVCVVGQVVGPAREGSAADDARREPEDGRRHDEVPRRHFDEVFFDAEHFFDGFKRNPRVHDASTRGGRRERRRLRRPVRHQRRLPAGRDQRDRRAGAARRLSTRSASTATTTPTAPSRTRCTAIDAGAVHVQGVINGYGERCGNANLASIAANLVLKKGVPVVTKEQLAGLVRDRALRRRDRERHAEPAAAVRRVVGVRAQGRAARVGCRSGAAICTSTSSPSWSATSATSS